MQYELSSSLIRTRGVLLQSKVRNVRHAELLLINKDP